MAEPRSAAVGEVAVPLPPWMQGWPPGLRPRRVDADPRAVRLLYVHPERGWARIWVADAPAPAGRAWSLGVSDGTLADAAALGRLLAALRARLAAAGGRGWAWLDGARGLARALLEAAADPSLQALRGLLDGHAGGPAPAIDLALRALAARYGRLGALRGLEPDADPPAADADPPELALRALLTALCGLPVAAIELAERAAARACGARERAAIGPLLAALGRADAAAACVLGGAGEGRMEPSELARAAAVAGRFDQATATIEAMSGEGGDGRERAVRALIDAGGLEEAHALLLRLSAAPGAPAWMRARLAELSLWKLDLAAAERQARAALEAGGDPGSAWMTLGAAAVAGGDPAAGLELLGRVPPGPAEATARLWRARALLALGSVAAAREAVRPAGFADRLAWILWRALIESVDRQGDPGREAFQVELVLAELVGADALRQAAGERAALQGLLRRALAGLGGNYSDRPSALEGGRLRPLSILSPRQRAVAGQEALLTRPLAAALAGLEEEAARAPGSPFPGTYRAEILLWTGDYEAARAAFAGLWGRFRTRWGYVGLGAALGLLGRPDEALRAWEAGLTEYTPLPAEATHAYRADLWIDQGRLPEAIAALEGAVAATPTRVGAWVSLALARARRGDAAGAGAALGRAAARAPGMVAAVADAVGLDPEATALAAREALAAALRRAMAGNRASTLLTWLDPRGRLRVLRSQPPERWDGVIERLGPLALDVLAGRLAAAAPWGR